MLPLRIRVALVVAGLTAPAMARADWPGDADQVVPCRPTFACTAELARAGTVEVEDGILFRQLPGSSNEWTNPFLLKLTLLRWLQFQLGSNGYTDLDATPSARYFDNVVFGPKVHLLDQRDYIPSLSFSAEASLPTGPQQGYLRTDDAALVGYASKDFGPLHMDWNAGLNLLRVERSPLAQEWTALALSTTVYGPIGAEGEGYLFSSASPLASRDGGALFAATWGLWSWLVIDAGTDIGLYPDTRRYSLFAGVSVVPFVSSRAPLPAK